jgi:prevent-host-death family protein
METIGVEEARHRLGDLVDAARLADAATVITRYGKAAAVIVPVRWYEQARVLIEKEGERP